jgi:hypothetical protein
MSQTGSNYLARLNSECRYDIAECLSEGLIMPCPTCPTNVLLITLMYGEKKSLEQVGKEGS